MKIRHRFFVLSAITVAALSWAAGARAQNSSVSYAGGTYTQNFNSLPYTPGTDVNTNNPITLGSTTYTFNNSAYSANTSAAGTFDFAAPVDASGTPTATSAGGFGLSATMPGWYGGAATLIKAGAQSGTQTTGGVISFGTTGGTNDGNRALGLLATSTTGITFFGVKLVNNTGASISQINFSVVGELWRQTTTAKALNYGYYVDPVTTDSIPVNQVTALGSISFATGTATTAANTTGPLATTNVAVANLALNTPWTNGSALWIVFQEPTNAGGSQGLAIDNFAFSAAVPEPSTWAGLLLGAAGVGGAIFRRRAKAA